MKILLTLIVIVVCASCAPATEFGQGSVKIIFEEKKDSFILFSQSRQQDVRKAFILAAQEDKKEIFYTYLNKQKNRNHFTRFAPFLGIDVYSTPIILFIQQGSKTYVYPSKEVTKQGLYQFVQKVKSGQAKRFFKSAPIPQDNDEFVKELVGKNFRDIVFGDQKQYLVKFYAPWCGHCKQMAPDFQAAAKAISVNPNIVLAKVDGTVNEVEGVQIPGYPTLWFFPRDKTEDPLRFNGERDKQGIIDWLRDHSEYDWIQPTEEERDQL